MSDDRIAKWDARHAAATDSGQVAQVLLRNEHLLPRSGTVLDLASGRGANSLWLARRGLRVTAWDYSQIAIDRLSIEAARSGIQVSTEVRDVVVRPPEPGCWDIVVVSHFLVRELARDLRDALNPHGRLFYQTFTAEGAGQHGPKCADFLLKPNELLAMFAGLTVRYYREDGVHGAPETQGLAMLVVEACVQPADDDNGQLSKIP